MAITLDATQRVAATGSGRFQLVLAGPGSGKTTTLTARFVHLVGEGGGPPAHSGADLHQESR